MRKFMFFVFIALGLSLFQIPADAQLKKRVAVFTFEDKTDQSWHWWSGKSTGDGMADMLTTELVKSGKYIVIERQEIASLLEEQRLGQSGIVTEQSAAQVGKMLGVELAIVGAVTEFGWSKGGTGGRVKGIGLGVKSQKATVAIDIRFINTTTGEIIAAENVRKNKSKKGISINTQKFDFNNKNDFDNSLVGKATRAAVDDIVELVEKQMDSMPWEGKVILVKGSDIYIKPGSDAGVNVGDEFAVYSQGEELIDPDTGLSLGSEESKIGAIRVSSIISGGKAAKCSVVSGSGFEKGNPVRQN